MLQNRKKSGQYRGALLPLGNQSGFSLIEIIIVLGILGTLIAVLVGGLGDAGAKAKIKATSVKAGQLQSDLLRYQSDMGKIPTTSEGLSALFTNPGSPKWAGPYGSEDDGKDDWGNAFEYELTPKGAKITSGGPDGTPGNEDDITFVNGKKLEVEAAPAAGGEQK